MIERAELQAELTQAYLKRAEEKFGGTIPKELQSDIQFIVEEHTGDIGQKNLTHLDQEIEFLILQHLHQNEMIAYQFEDTQEGKVFHRKINILLHSKSEEEFRKMEKELPSRDYFVTILESPNGPAWGK